MLFHDYIVNVISNKFMKISHFRTYFRESVRYCVRTTEVPLAPTRELCYLQEEQVLPQYCFFILQISCFTLKEVMSGYLNFYCQTLEKPPKNFLR